VTSKVTNGLLHISHIMSHIFYEIQYGWLPTKYVIPVYGITDP
jgi:hypothetical protein